MSTQSTDLGKDPIGRLLLKLGNTCYHSTIS